MNLFVLIFPTYYIFDLNKKNTFATPPLAPPLAFAAGLRPRAIFNFPTIFLHVIF